MSSEPLWRLIHSCALKLTSAERVPFTRGELISCVQEQSRNAKADSINPIIQGMTDNLKGGAPGSDGKRLLHSVGRGKFVLLAAHELANDKQKPSELTHNTPKARNIAPPQSHDQEILKTPEGLSEDELKEKLQTWLNCDGWKTEIAWGRKQGADIIATRNTVTWVIEVKGLGSLDAMRVNYFIAILGELLQRMNDPHAKYSIALPNIRQYRSLWERLPDLAKLRTSISAIFVSPDGTVYEDA
ncbi:MAG: hypothetical protein HZB71_11425 [Betaproteobacteria bacterium]|nr:hypothetical protein [Betaproteobacteria bacterium]